MDNPNFDLIIALEQHKNALKIHKKRITKLLQTIDMTINHLKKDTIIKAEDLYKGLPKEFGTTHQETVAEKYGKDALGKSEKSLIVLGEKVQPKIAQHYTMIRQFWGTTSEVDKQANAYAGLGQMYLYDERFTKVNGKSQPEFAQFLADAMAYFAETQLK